MQVLANNQPLEVLMPRYRGRQISIAIDSSKRNTGLTVGDENCNVLDVYDINGKFDGTGEADVLVLCKAQREFLHTLLEGAKVVYAGIENIITVDKPSRMAGISQHMSRFKITAVFMSFIFFLQEEFGITPLLINNNTWKSAVLPREFTSRDIGKGSLAYFKSISSKYAYYSDDATDSICILMYMKKFYRLRDVFRIQQAEFKRHMYYMEIVRADTSVQAENAVEYAYNQELSLEQNATVMVNHLGQKQFGFANIPVGLLSYAEIYEMVVGTFPEYSEEARLVVRRVEQ